MRRSRNTLIGRVHEHARLEAEHDVGALYEFVDPAIRARRESLRDGERQLTLADLQAFCETIYSAEVEEVEILQARKRCERHGGRPAALVRSIVRYNGNSAPAETRAVWVRDDSVWYFTTDLR
jgi:hypothetical protein